MVTKGDEMEHSLYNKMRNAEYARQKQEQTVRRMQQQLAELKRKNAVRVKNELAQTHKEEKELEQTLIREKAELDKVRLKHHVEECCKSLIRSVYIISYFSQNFRKYSKLKAFYFWLIVKDVLYKEN